MPPAVMDPGDLLGQARANAADDRHLEVVENPDCAETEDDQPMGSGDDAEATTHGGSDMPEGVESPLRDASTAQAQAREESAGE